MTRFNAAFWRWFGDSKVVDRNGNPRVVYHGTTHEFTIFSPDRANIENDWGRGIYFSSDRRDVSINYAGVGPDLKQRIELYGEREGISEEQAYRALVGTAAAVIVPCYLSLQNPVILGGKHETVLDYEYGPTEDDIQHFMKDAREELGEDADEQELRDKAREIATDNRYEQESGLLFDFFTNLAHAASHYEEVDLSQIEELKGELLNDSVRASVLRDKLKDEHSGITYATDEEGNLASHEIIREAFERTGFDGVIDHTARQRFGLRESQFSWGRKKRYGMRGMFPGTVHYVAFRPEQIKSIWNVGTWDPGDPDIRRNPW